MGQGGEFRGDIPTAEGRVAHVWTGRVRCGYRPQASPSGREERPRIIYLSFPIGLTARSNIAKRRSVAGYSQRWVAQNMSSCQNQRRPTADGGSHAQSLHLGLFALCLKLLGQRLRHVLRPASAAIQLRAAIS